MFKRVFSVRSRKRATFVKVGSRGVADEVLYGTVPPYIWFFPDMVVLRTSGVAE